MAPLIPTTARQSAKPATACVDRRVVAAFAGGVLSTLCILALAWAGMQQGQQFWRLQHVRHALHNHTAHQQQQQQQQHIVGSGSQPQFTQALPAQQMQEVRAQLPLHADQQQHVHQGQRAAPATPVTASGTEASERFAYVYYIGAPLYMCSALVNAARIIELGKSPNFDIVFLTPTHFRGPEAMHQAADRLGIIIREVPMLELGGFSDTPMGHALRGQTGYYLHCMVKLQAFNVTGYKRILFMDADQLVLRNLESLFTQIPSTILAAPRAYWLNPGLFPKGYRSDGWRDQDGPEVGPQMKFGSYFMLIEPSASLMNRVFNKYYPGGKPSFQDVFDMDLLNIEFKDDVTLLPGNTVLLSCDFLDREDRRPQAIRDFVPDLAEWFRRGYVLHFSCPGKPWSLASEAFNMTHAHARDELKGVWYDWHRLSKNVCPPGLQ